MHQIPFIAMAVLMYAVIWGLVVLGAWLLIKNGIRYYFHRKNSIQEPDNNANITPLKLQAHERLVVFVERLNPSNLFLRLYQQGMSLQLFQSILLNEIRSEYQHNVSQQLYVSPATWSMVKNLKEDTLAMINNAAKALPQDAPGAELSKTILQHMAAMESNPYDLTQHIITKDIQEWL